MNIELFIGLMGVIVPLINTSLLCWVVWRVEKALEEKA